METFPPLLALCEGNLPVTGGFPHRGPVMANLIFTLLLSKASKIYFSLLTQQFAFKGYQDQPPSIKHSLWVAINFGLHTNIKYWHSAVKITSCWTDWWSQMPLCSYNDDVNIAVKITSCWTDWWSQMPLCSYNDDVNITVILSMDQTDLYLHWYEVCCCRVFGHCFDHIYRLCIFTQLFWLPGVKSHTAQPTGPDITL